MKIFLAFTTMFCLASCGDDEPGAVAINSLDASYGAVRGTAVTVNYTAIADDGIASIWTDINGQSEVITTDDHPTSYSGSIDITLPGDAILHAEYPITITVTDVEGETSVASTKVVAEALLPTVPTTYAFSRAGESTVSYSGQNERLDQVEAIKAYLKTGDAGQALSATVLEAAYANENGDGNGFFSFSSTKQLKNKSFQPDIDAGFMSSLFADAAAASTSGQDAADGIAGLITRETKGSTILVDAHGREFTQMIEKGLMGTVMYHQIYNTYFSEARIGDQVENTALRDGKNYTDMEHHWDEAFGYFNAPVDFTSSWPADRTSEDRFWSHYSNVVDPFLGTNDKIMNAFTTGRTAIVNNDLATKNTQRVEAQNLLDIVAAATAVHYINSTLSALNAGRTGEAFHTLSEAWTFTNALRYNPDRRLSLAQLAEIMETDYGSDGNFWNVTTDGLNKAKATIVGAYTELESYKDEL